MELDIDVLSAFTEVGGVPGYEDRVRAVVVEAYEEAGLSVEVDAMGNVVGTVEGTERPDYEVVVAAHMDEIGFMVSHVDDDGFLELDPLGGWNPLALWAERVAVHTEHGTLPGVVGAPPPHTMEEDDEHPEVDDARVDLGLPADVVEEQVAVGDLVTMRAPTERVGEHVVGKSLDDRLCLYAMVEAARAAEPPVTVHFAATTQEEVGLRGAAALGVDVDADLAIALDVTVASDVPGVDEGDHVTDPGDGVAIKLKDGSVITSRPVTRRLREVAEATGVPYQLEVLPKGGTDTGMLQRVGGATPAGALSIPTRYLHTVTESAHVDDVEAMGELLVAFLESDPGAHEYLP